MTLTREEMDSDIAAVKMYKRWPESHPTMARAFSIVHEWKRKGLLDEHAHALDGDIVDRMKELAEQYTIGPGGYVQSA